jgi:large subunit ribosomal protein L14
VIQAGTILNVADNTGAKKAMCIKVLGGSKKFFASIGDKIIISIKEVLHQKDKSVNLGGIYCAVIVRTKKEKRRKNGFVIKFFENAVVLLDKQNELIGSRVFGVIPREIKERGYQKIISLSQEVS